MKVIKKPVEYEAFYWTGDNFKDAEEWWESLPSCYGTGEFEKFYDSISLNVWNQKGKEFKTHTAFCYDVIVISSEGKVEILNMDKFADRFEKVD